MLTALLIFPCCAILWLLVCDRLGLVTDEPPLIDGDAPTNQAGVRPLKPLLQTPFFVPD
jgi:hypothetical protein